MRHCIADELLRCFQRVKSGQGHHSCHLIQTLNHLHHQKLFHFNHLYAASAAVKKAAGRAAFLTILRRFLLFVLHVNVLGVDYAFIFLLFLLCSAITGCACLWTRTRSTLRWLR